MLRCGAGTFRCTGCSLSAAFDVDRLDCQVEFTMRYYPADDNYDCDFGGRAELADGY